MAEKRNITKDDIFLEARLLSEGVRIERKTPAEKPAAFPGTIIMDGCEITTLIRPNTYARLLAVVEDDRPGYTRTGRSYNILMLTDEIWRRGQAMGKLPPGLPKQGT